MDRKTFLQTAGLGLSALGTLSTLTGQSRLRKFLLQKLDRVGIQLFSCPKLLETDPEAALRLLSDMGYSEIELFGPYSISAESNKASWAQLTPLLGFSGSGYFGKTRNDFKVLANTHGLRIPSLHTDLDTLETLMPALAQEARNLGAGYVTLPAIPEERRRSLDDYKRMAETFNAIGKSAREQGVRFAYHNHGYGLQSKDGEIPFQVLMDATDPELVFLEMDIFWTTAGRANPVDYLQKYKGRYRMMHLKDMQELQYFSGDGGDPSQWMALFPLMATAGTGVLDLEAIIDAGLACGVEHFFVEQDLVAHPETALKESLDYLQTL